MIMNITNTRTPCTTMLMTGLTVEALLTDENLDSAFDWLCQRRKNWPPDADVWRFRRHWPDEKARLRTDLLEGTYQVGLLQRVVLVNGEEVDLWSARDSLVMKMLALTLPQYLPLSSHCMHLKGYGGSKDAVRMVMARLPHIPFVFKTDVQSYYASIDHQLLLDRLSTYITDRCVMDLIGQYLLRCAERGGLFWEYKQGIALGCPLSPIIGAFFLSELDAALEHGGLFYVRFMDDILVLAPTRWKLRNAVKIVNEVLASLKLQKHPDKTYIRHYRE
jgi:RNA-directed DNA polymerase